MSEKKDILHENNRNHNDHDSHQIDTYGNNNREMPGKISQSLQINREAANFLVNLLIKEFGLK